MAEVLRGKARGRQATIVQFSNDWFVVDVDEGESNKVYPPSSLRLDADEVAMVVEAVQAGQTGRMMDYYDLDLNAGTFTRAKRGAPR